MVLQIWPAPFWGRSLTIRFEICPRSLSQFLYIVAEMTRKLVLFPFLAIVLLAPLPFASNRPWSWALLSLLVGVLVVLEVLFSGRQGGNNQRFMVRMLPGIVLAGVTVAWILFQIATATDQFGRKRHAVNQDFLFL